MSELAQRRVRDFQQRCGETALHLAYHAALPVALNADLLHFLRINFFLDPPEPLPYTIEFEFLLSPLCREIDEGLYEIEPEIRDILLVGLAQQYDEERIRGVATLLWQYVDRFDAWSDQVELRRAQQLTALNFLSSEKAQQWLSTVETSFSHRDAAGQEWFIAMQQEIKNQTQQRQSIDLQQLQFPKQSTKDFFISYAQTDRQWAEWIAWILEDAGYSTVIQAWDFQGSRNFALDMQRAVIEAERTITVLSEDYLNSQLSHQEWTSAITQDPANKRPRLLPVRVKECYPSGLFSAIVYLDLVGLSEAEAKAQLLAMVNDTPIKSTLSRTALPVHQQTLLNQKRESLDIERVISSEPVKIYISYSSKDKRLKDEFLRYLNVLQQEGTASIWHDGLILPGSEWASEIDLHLNSAQIILLLVSSSSLSSQFISNLEVARAMERHDAGEVLVIPIILRPCSWTSMPFARLQVLPRNGKPITNCKDRRAVFDSITQEIRQAVQQISSHSQTISNELTARSIHRLERKKAELQQQYFSLSRQLRFLQRDYANAVNADLRSRLQHQIEQTDVELEQLDNALEELERNLHPDS